MGFSGFANWGCGFGSLSWRLFGRNFNRKSCFVYGFGFSGSRFWVCVADAVADDRSRADVAAVSHSNRLLPVLFPQGSVLSSYLYSLVLPIEALIVNPIWN